MTSWILVYKNFIVIIIYFYRPFVYLLFMFNIKHYGYLPTNVIDFIKLTLSCVKKYTQTYIYI